MEAGDGQAVQHPETPGPQAREEGRAALRLRLFVSEIEPSDALGNNLLLS